MLLVLKNWGKIFWGWGWGGEDCVCHKSLTTYSSDKYRAFDVVAFLLLFSSVLAAKVNTIFIWL